MAQVKTFRQLAIKEKPKVVKILSTGNQFHGATPGQITLKATHEGIDVATYAWFLDESETVYGTAQNFTVANNQVVTVLVVKVVVIATNGVAYEDTLSISKVIDGESVVSQLPVQREWKTGDIYYNNETRIDYIYHRATNSWWRLRDGFNAITVGVNPGSQFVQLSSSEQLVVGLLITENANIAGFIFKNEKLVSQLPWIGDPNISMNGRTGEVEFNNAKVRGIINATGGTFQDVSAENFSLGSGRIGALQVYANGLLYNHSSAIAENYSKTYFISFLFPENSTARIGNLAPLLSGNVKASSMFGCMYNRSSDSGTTKNIGTVVAASGARRNHAVYIETGDIAGLAIHTEQITSSGYQVTTEGIVINPDMNIDVYMPTGVYRFEGRTVTIKRLYRRTVTVRAAGVRFYRDAIDSWLGAYNLTLNGETVTFTWINNSWVITQYHSW